MGGRNQVMRMPKSPSIRELVGGGDSDADTHLQLFIMPLLEFQQSAVLEAAAVAAAAARQHTADDAVTSFWCSTHCEDG